MDASFIAKIRACVIYINTKINNRYFITFFQTVAVLQKTISLFDKLQLY